MPCALPHHVLCTEFARVKVSRESRRLEHMKTAAFPLTSRTTSAVRIHHLTACRQPVNLGDGTRRRGLMRGPRMGTCELGQGEIQQHKQ